MNVWTESGDILDLDVIPKITRIMNEDEFSASSSNICDQRNILSGLLGDGDALRPAPLHHITISTDIFEVIADVLNTSTNGIDDATCAINELQGITAALENSPIHNDSGNKSIPPYIMNQNQITATLQQYDVVARVDFFAWLKLNMYVQEHFPLFLILFLLWKVDNTP